ncbi:hypothetical protein C8Q73DRAFT_669912 [Cubamyces lactineus]|nr:hypothetical protein C8Q73DRAFT_669912 [Cubamyces lactineus]
MPKDLQDKEGRLIEVGDLVETKYRGGKRQGEVEAILENEQDAQERGSNLGVKIVNPPKVVFKDQVGVTDALVCLRKQPSEL